MGLKKIIVAAIAGSMISKIFKKKDKKERKVTEKSR